MRFVGLKSLHGGCVASTLLLASVLSTRVEAQCTLQPPGVVSFEPNPPGVSRAYTPYLGGGFSNQKGPDIIHAWTSRELVRLTSTEIQRKHGGRLVVQLEDNEQEILAQALLRPWDELRTLPATELNRLVPADYSHPVLSGEFIAIADGVTVIIDSLRRFVPPGKACATIWPAADSRYFYPRPVPSGFRAALQLDPATTVLFYHGNAHAANAGEMRALYEAVLQLNRTGHPTRLIRTGTDQVDFSVH